MTRGQKHLIDRWANDLLAQRYSYKHENPVTKTVENVQLQLGVRPIQLWELAFPKQHLQEILRTIQPADGIGQAISCSRIRKIMMWVIKKMRKYLKLKPIPKYDPKGPQRIISKRYVATYGIGITDDIFKYIPIEQV